MRHNFLILSFFVMTMICNGGNSQELPLAYPNCGLYALAAISGLLGNPLSCETLSQSSPNLKSSQTSIDDILKAAQNAGIPLSALRGGKVSALLKLPPPYIIGLRSNHLVAVLGNESDALQIMDQTGETRMLSINELEKQWSGELLLPKPVDSSPESLPMVHVLTHKMHLGLLESLEPVNTRFVVYSYANEPIQLRITDMSCGCLKPSLHPNLVNPGESAVIETVFSPKKSVNPAQKESFVVEWSLSDGREAGRETFTVEAVINKPFQFSPNVLQGEIYHGKWTMETPKTHLISEDKSGDRWIISKTQWITPSLGELIQSTTTVEIAPTEELPVGIYNGTISINVNTENEQKERIVSLPVHLQVIGDVVALSNPLDFGFINNITETIKTLSFKDIKGREIEIVSVPPELEIVKEEFEKTDSNSIRVRINPKWSEKVIARKCVFTVKANNKVEKIQVEVNAVINSNQNSMPGL